MEYQSENKTCQNCQATFTIEPDDFLFYEKMKVPPPTFCPECRMIRRFNYRNESVLFRRPDAHDGKEIFSGFSPDSKVMTYENAFWYGTDWDALENGREYDFTRSFFEQIKELLSMAPIPARSVYNMENSDYCNEASECKNAYLCFNTDFIENCAYLRKCRRVKESYDCYEVEDNELCYENILVDKSYRTFFSLDCESCVDVWFSKDCRGCTNCFGCVNLRNKSYHFFNEPCTKVEYEEKTKKYMSGSYKELQEMRETSFDFWLNFPNKFFHGVRVVDSTGERMFDSKNVKNVYYVKGAENIRYCQDIWTKTTNSYDYSVWGDGAENVYECMTCGMGCFNIKFCFNCWENARDLEYCVYCMGSSNCFGCVGLYKKEYCIFNKQYTKEQYEELREKIIAHMNEMPYVDAEGLMYKYGEFFPQDISPVSYNESLAQDFFPLTEETAKDRGFVWHKPNSKEYQTTINAEDLPDSIGEVSDEILKEIIKCDTCSRAYRVIQPELQFYKKIGLPLPRKCHNCRFEGRFKFVNPPKLWHRSCMKEGCVNEFETSYAPDRPEIVYCESCYQKEVI